MKKFIITLFFILVSCNFVYADSDKFISLQNSWSRNNVDVNVLDVLAGKTPAKHSYFIKRKFSGRFKKSALYLKTNQQIEEVVYNGTFLQPKLLNKNEYFVKLPLSLNEKKNVLYLKIKPRNVEKLGFISSVFLLNETDFEEFSNYQFYLNSQNLAKKNINCSSNLYVRAVSEKEYHLYCQSKMKISAFKRNNFWFLDLTDNFVNTAKTFYLKDKTRVVYRIYFNPSSNLNKTSLAASVKNFGRVQQFWLNDELLECSDSKSGLYEDKTQFYLLPNNFIKYEQENCLTVITGKDIFDSSGLMKIGNFYLGKSVNLLKSNASENFVDVFLIGCILIISFFFFLLFIRRSNLYYLLYYSLFSFLSAMFLFFRSEAKYDFLGDAVNTLRLEYIVTALLYPVFIMFTNAFIKNKNCVLEKICKSIFGIFYTLMFFVTLAFVFTSNLGTCKWIMNNIVHPSWVVVTILLFCLLITDSCFYFIRLIRSRKDKVYKNSISNRVEEFTEYEQISLFRKVIHYYKSKPIPREYLIASSQKDGFFLQLVVTLMAFSVAFDTLIRRGFLPEGLMGQYFNKVLFFSSIIISFFISIRLYSLLDEAFEDNESLKVADQVKDKFLLSTTHELYAPLNGIIKIAELLDKGQSGELTSAQKENVGTIIQSGKRLSILVNDLLDLSRLKKQKTNLKIKKVNLATIVQNVILVTESLVGQKAIKLINNVAGDIYVRADEDRLSQIIFNLIENAIKFTDRGYIRIIALHQNGDIEIIVEDTGVGLNKGEIDRLVDPEQKVNSFDSSVGLTITKAFIEMHNSHLAIDSKEGEGTRFSFILKEANLYEPLEVSYDLSKRRNLSTVIYDSPTDEVFSDFAKNIQLVNNDLLNILIVSDNLREAIPVVEFLKEEGFLIDVLASGDEAVEYFHDKNKIALVILGANIKGSTNYELCKEIRQMYKNMNLPIMLITEDETIETVLAVFNVGANDYLTKPFDKRELLARISSLINFRKSMQMTNKINMLQLELETAKQIQQSIMPRIVPDVNRLQVAASSRQMEMVGGDLYDFYHHGDDCFGVFLCDVIGHGIPAALISSMVKVSFNLSSIKYGKEPIKLLNEMNKSIKSNCPNQPVAAIYAYFDTKSSELFLARAGHIPPYLYRQENSQIIEILPKGKILGCFENINCELYKIKLQAGDRLVLCTDGIIEARNSSRILLGEENFKELIYRFADQEPDVFIDSVYASIVDWVGKNRGLEDDFTLIAIDYI